MENKTRFEGFTYKELNALLLSVLTLKFEIRDFWPESAFKNKKLGTLDSLEKEMERQIDLEFREDCNSPEDDTFEQELMDKK